MLSHTSVNWWMRLESNQQCREAGDLQSPGVTSFPTHPYFGSPSTDRTYDIFVNSEAQLPLCYRGIDWLQRQDSHLRSPAYETGEDDWTPLLCDNWRRRWDSNPPGMDRQSTALPEDYYGILVLRTGFDPASPT